MRVCEDCRSENDILDEIYKEIEDAGKKLLEEEKKKKREKQEAGE